MRFRAIHLLACIALTAAAAPARLAAASSPELRVDRVEFPVVLASGLAQTVVGYLYHQGNGHGGTIQLLVHGAGFNHQYWDVPDFNARHYSYARYMAGQGYDALAIDLPGAGESSQPDGDSFGLTEAADTLHQVAASLRSGANPIDEAYEHIVLVGFSNGSVAAIYAQGTYHDADALITTGWVHGCRPLPIDPTDPVLLQALASPYVSLREPARIGLLFYLPSVDPAVLAYDAVSLADHVPRRELLDLLGVHADIAQRCADGSSTTLTRSQWVTGPVLVQAGENDALIAPASIVDVTPTERSFYASASDVTVERLADIGHAFNLHTTNLDGWARIADWLGVRLRD